MLGFAEECASEEEDLVEELFRSAEELDVEQLDLEGVAACGDVEVLLQGDVDEAGEEEPVVLSLQGSNWTINWMPTCLRPRATWMLSWMHIWLKRTLKVWSDDGSAQG